MISPMFRDPPFTPCLPHGPCRCTVPNAAIIQQYDVEVVAFILERSAVVALALDGDRTKRCSNGEVHAAILPAVWVLNYPCSFGPTNVRAKQNEVLASLL